MKGPEWPEWQRGSFLRSAAAPPELPAALTEDEGWILVERGVHPTLEHEVESCFAVSNGYVGSRGSLAEGSALSAPATFVAGVFGWSDGQEDATPVLMAAPDWMCLRGELRGEPLEIDLALDDNRRVLDLRQGLLWRLWEHRDPSGRTTRIRGLRLASLGTRHLLFQSVLFTPVNHAGRLRLEAWIARPIRPPSAPAFTAVPATEDARGGGAPGLMTLSLRAPGSGVEVAFVARTTITAEVPVEPRRQGEQVDGNEAEGWELDVELGRTYRMDRVVAIATSREDPRPLERALARLDAAGPPEELVGRHVRAWDARWRFAAIDLDGDPAAERALRFAAYHLIGAANPDDDRVSVGARALTGAAYQGHVFWDTEVYMLPFYTFTDPPSARALLGYRIHTLPAARDKARALGYRGALYAWESATDGCETTPHRMLTPSGEVLSVRNGELEQHISADVAWGIASYLDATGDEDLLLDGGGEVLIETARFWASRVRRDERGRAHILEVIGPDEYHDGVDDNAYTNGMARWNLERGAATVSELAARHPERLRELSARIGLRHEEPAGWRRTAAALVTGLDEASGCFEQFRGYDELLPVDLSSEARPVALDLLWGAGRLRRTQALKQADVVLLLALLWDQLPPSVRATNFRHYEPRTCHGSSLSPAVHALVAARLGDLGLAERYFRMAAAIDLENRMGNAAGGVHAAALGGLWQAAIGGCAGVRLVGGTLIVEPHLLPAWRALRFPLRLHGARVEVSILDGGEVVEVEHDAPAQLRVRLADGEPAALEPGRRHLARRGQRRWE